MSTNSAIAERISFPPISTTWAPASSRNTCGRQASPAPASRVISGDDHVGVHVDRHALSLRARSGPGRRTTHERARRARRAHRPARGAGPPSSAQARALSGPPPGSWRAPPPRRSRRGRAGETRSRRRPGPPRDSLRVSVSRAIERIAPNEPRAASAPPSAAVAASSPSVTPSSGESSPSSAFTVRTALSDPHECGAESEDRVALDRHAATPAARQQPGPHHDRHDGSKRHGVR